MAPGDQCNLKTVGSADTNVPAASGNHRKLMELWGRQNRRGRAP